MPLPPDDVFKQDLDAVDADLKRETTLNLSENVPRAQVMPLDQHQLLPDLPPEPNLNFASAPDLHT